MSSQQNISLDSLLPEYWLSRCRQPQRTMSVPLSFEYDPLEVLTKQLTKLNSHYQQRIVYLGPRWNNSIAVHKRYSGPGEPSPHFAQYQKWPFHRYQFDFSQVSKYSSIADVLQRDQHNRNAVYYRAFEGMNPTLQSANITFDGAFQSANLDCAVKVRSDQYDLFTRIDSNSRGHTQWFYFSIRNSIKGKVRLHICNLSKANTLYQNGMRPYMFSTKKNLLAGETWQQNGTDIKFQEKRWRYRFVYEKCKVRKFWRLSFTTQFTEADDTIYIAYCIPYPYSQLLKEVEDIYNLNKRLVTVNFSYKSQMGVSMPILKITDSRYSDSGKRCLILTGRVHPGESNGSIVLSGLLRFLCTAEAAQICRRCVIIVVPMLNPDGVILGNSRTGTMGKDLNREYTHPNKQLYPQIYLIKHLATQIKLRGLPVHMYLDFHGHSQKKNTFFYGPQYTITKPQYFKCKILPKMISLNTPMFRYYSCIFRIAEDKKSTGRAVMFEQLTVPYAYTVESSIGMYHDTNQLKTLEYTRALWLETGVKVGESLDQYFEHLVEYEQFIAQRKLHRVSRKLPSPSKRLISSQKSQKQNGKIRILTTEQQKQPETTHFVQIIEQIKQDDLVAKQADDAEADSDSADQKDEPQPTRYVKMCEIVTAKQTKPLLMVTNTKMESALLQRKTLFGIKQISRSPPKDQLASDQMEILNEVVSTRLVTMLGRQTNRRSSSPSKSSYVKDSAYSPDNLLSHERTKRTLQVISSRGLRQLKKKTSKFLPVPLGVQGQKSKHPQKQVNSTHNLKLYTPNITSYTLPLTEQARQRISLSLKKKMKKSVFKRKQFSKTLQKDRSFQLLEDLLNGLNQPSTQKLTNNTQVKFHYDRLLANTERLHSDRNAHQFAATFYSKTRDKFQIRKHTLKNYLHRRQSQFKPSLTQDVFTENLNFK